MTFLIISNPTRRLGLHHPSRWRIHIRSLVQSVWGNEDVEPFRDDEANPSDTHDEVCQGEGGNVQGVLALEVESWIGEGHDDGENWWGDVADDETPGDRDSPLIPGCYDEV